MTAVGARLTYLQISQHDWLTRRARAQQLDVEPQTAVRGLILDRQGRELARSVGVDSFFADPREIENADEAATQLARVLDVDATALATREESDRTFGRDPRDASGVRREGRCKRCQTATERIEHNLPTLHGDVL